LPLVKERLEFPKKHNCLGISFAIHEYINE